MTIWPEDGSTLPVEELATPIRNAIRYAYQMRRKNRKSDIPWDGPGISEDALANVCDAAERLSQENLTYAEDEQGRDALTEIITLAINIGMEQGRRHFINSDEFKTLKIQADVGNILLTEQKLLRSIPVLMEKRLGKLKCEICETVFDDVWCPNCH